MLIGIGRASRVGKDTAAQGLVDQLGFQRVGFADKLKELAFEADFLVTSATRTINTNIGHGRLKHVVTGLGGWEQAKNTYPEVRIGLENLGDGARKVFGKDFWIEQALKASAGHADVVFSDVRKLNEAEAIKAAGGYLVEILRPGYQPRPFEAELDDWDWDEVLVNNGTEAELQAHLVAFVKNLQETQ